MQPLRSLLIQALVVLATGAALTTGAQATAANGARPAGAAPAAAPTDADARDIDLARLAQPHRSQAHCRPVAMSQPSGAGPIARTRMDLGGTHCGWVCYPGSGCEYVCRFFPE